MVIRREGCCALALSALLFSRRAATSQEESSYSIAGTCC